MTVPLLFAYRHCRYAVRAQMALLVSGMTFDSFESRLQRNPYLGGNSACATDIAIFPFVRQFAAVERIGFCNSPCQQYRRCRQC